MRSLIVIGDRGCVDRLVRSGRLEPGRRVEIGGSSIAITVDPHADEVFVDVTADRVIVLDGWLMRHGERGGVPTAQRCLDAELVQFEGFEFEGLLTIVDADGARSWTDSTGTCPAFSVPIDAGAAVSTELRSVTSLIDDPVISREAAVMTLVMGAARPPTALVAGVQRLRAGHRYGWSPADGGRHWYVRRQERRWWGRPDVDRVRAVLRDAVADRLADSTYPALLLSSGLDSFLLAAVARKELGARVHGYTFDYGGRRGPWNEHEEACRRAALLDIPCTVVTTSGADVAARFEDLVERFEAPLGVGLHSTGLLEVAERGHDVVLSGIDVEEFYDPWPTALLRLGVAHLGPGRAAGLERALSGGPSSTWRDPLRRLVAYGGTGTRQRTAPLPLLAHLLGEDVVDDVLRQSHRLLLADLEVVREEWARDRIVLAGDDAWWMAAGPYWWYRWTRPSGLRARMPLDDTRVERELAAHLSRGRDRVVFREVLDAVLGAHRPVPKYPQQVPIDDWMRCELGEVAGAWLEKAEPLGLWEPQVGLEILAAHRRGSIDVGLLLLSMSSLVAFEDRITARADRR